ncbi:VOC family protein [Telluribacter sp. SYSU D00476]|uniref:VOC family protein n=1 Tax=Telluribacter sp. SYSU D00476 TaxID=2811430 RepID=UPI00286DC3E0|nr:VOC family protein [Telluribacter sp. SYSU D00476]
MGQNRRNWLTRIGVTLAGIGLANLKLAASPTQETQQPGTEAPTNQMANGMPLGAFSVSLNVKDLNASKQFYENLGFTAFAGAPEQNYYIMKNGNALIGLFHGMFDKTILTFNPGWDENAAKVEKYNDVRAIQRHLKSKGIKPLSEADEKTTGPGSLIVVDPDGNQILIDQHV